jgi:hypothetical protein
LIKRVGVAEPTFHRQRPYLAGLALATQSARRGLCGEEDIA